MNKAGILIESWKLPIFEKHLKKGGYTYEQADDPKNNLIVLTVPTDDVQRLARVIEAAQAEARASKPMGPVNTTLH